MSDLAARRGASQLLHRPSSVRHPADVVRESGPVQAQEPRAAKLAFRARAAGLTAADVDRARTEERSLLRAWVMRKTIHLIEAEDAGWMVPLFAEATVRWSRGRLAKFGLDHRGQDRVMKFIHDLIDSEGPLTRSEVGVRLEEAGFEAAAEHKVHFWLLATLDGELCLGPDRGAYACLVRTSDWLGKLERRSREESLAELALRYLRGYAPATERDFARWAGLPLRDARVGFERIAGELAQDGELLRLKRGAKRAGKSPVVRLLGAYDNYNLGYVDRGFAVPPEHEKQINPGGGIVRPSILVDGRAVATWTSKRSGNRLAVTIEPFEPLSPAVHRAVEADVADLGRFEELAATIPRP